MSKAKVQAAGILRKSRDLTWQTPGFVLDRVRAFFGGPIPFDPATAPDNPTQALRFCAGPAGTLFAKESLESKNGLEIPWDWPWWVNPPFARAWIEKIGHEGARGEGLALLPCNRFETPFMQRTLATARVVCWVDASPFQRGLRNSSRVAFISSKDGAPCDANPFASMILGFKAEATGETRFTDRFAEALEPLGTVQFLKTIGEPHATCMNCGSRTRLTARLAELGRGVCVSCHGDLKFTEGGSRV